MENKNSLTHSLLKEEFAEKVADKATINILQWVVAVLVVLAVFSFTKGIAESLRITASESITQTHLLEDIRAITEENRNATWCVVDNLNGLHKCTD